MKKENKRLWLFSSHCYLTLTVFATLVTLPDAKAHLPAININTFTYVSVAPNTAGIGQEVLIAFSSNEIPPTAYGPWGDKWAFYVDITNPQGINQTIGPIISDPVGGAYTMFTPTEVGTYTIVARFPSQVSTGELNNPAGKPASYFTAAGLQVFVNDTYLASAREPVTLSVQQDQLPKYQDAYQVIIGHAQYTVLTAIRRKFQDNGLPEQTTQAELTISAQARKVRIFFVAFILVWRHCRRRNG